MGDLIGTIIHYDVVKDKREKYIILECNDGTIRKFKVSYGWFLKLGMKYKIVENKLIKL